MQTAITPFSTKQSMTNDKLEFYHYKDVSFGKVKPHMHTHYELYFFLNGDTDYIVGDKQFHLKPGDFMIIEPNQLHFPDVKVEDGSRPYERFILWIRPEYLSQLQTKEDMLQEALTDIHNTGSCHFRPDTDNMQRILSILEDMLRENSEQEIGYSQAIEALFTQLLIQINRVFHSKRAFQKSSSTTDLYSQIVRFIHANLKENITLDDLASEFFVSRSYISRIFRQHLDISVHEYILKLKLDQVLSEIAKGQPISDAALEYGFNNYSTFYRQCVKEFGMSPRDLVNSFSEEEKPDVFLSDGETF